MKNHFKPLFVLVLFLITSQFLYAQDLSGTWEGKQSGNGKQYNVTLYLTKIDAGYSGVAVYKEGIGIKTITSTATSINTNVHINAADLLSQRPTARVQIMGSFINNVFSFTDIGVIDINIKNVQMISHSDISYHANKGKEKLAGQIGNNKIELTKKNNDFPDEYSKYKQDVVTFSQIKFSNASRSDKIKYNDKGILSFTITNNSNYDISGIVLSLSIKEKNSGIILPNNNSGSFSLAKEKSISPETDIVSGFDLPQDSIHFIISGVYNKVTIFNTQIALSTIPFFLTNKTSVNESSNAILKVLQGYYGFNKAPCSSIVGNLNQSILSGNKMAPMWKAAFLSRGLGGYGMDEDASLPLAQKAYNDVSNAARNGDAEAQYLMFYAVALGLTSDASRDVAGDFLKRSAEAGFLPAMYDYALYLAKDKVYGDSYNYLKDCYDKGMQVAAVEIGVFNQQGYGAPKNMQQAIEWYHKGEQFGDPNAMIRLARLYLVGDEELTADPIKAVAYANRAVELKSTAAMDFLAKIYLNGRGSISQNSLKAVALYKEAAALGDNEAMTALAYLYMPGGEKTGVPQDEKISIFWAKKSAENGGAECMPLLAHLYATGKINGQKDIIRARFWDNQARLNGVGEKDNTAANATATDMANVISGIDFSDHYSYYKDTETGDLYRSNDGPDLFGSLFGAVLSGMSQRRANQQEVINGLEYIYTFHGKKIYGGTLTSKLTTNISLFEGERVKIKGYGAVNLGMMAGTGGPDGVAGFQGYCVDPEIPHGAIMVGMNGKWTLAGSDKTYKAPVDGKLQFAINDNDYTNNKGYFDVVVTTN